MRSLEARELDRLQTLRRQLRPLALQQSDLDKLVEEWTPCIEPSESEIQELFAIARPDGSTTGVLGPRWLFHRFGLPHRATHVGLLTPSDLLILQKRSHTKSDYPSHWHLPASGHVPQEADGKEISY